MFASPASHHPHQHPLHAGGTAQPSQTTAGQQPLPPPSLREVLDAFGRDGNGDREMLMSILASKRAEEEVRSASAPFCPCSLALLGSDGEARTTEL